MLCLTRFMGESTDYMRGKNMNDVLMFISLAIMGLGFTIIPFAPLLMWYLADKFGAFDIDKEE